MPSLNCGVTKLVVVLLKLTQFPSSIMYSYRSIPFVSVTEFHDMVNVSWLVQLEGFAVKFNFAGAVVSKTNISFVKILLVSLLSVIAERESAVIFTV